MAAELKHKMSQERFDALQKELEHLETVRTKEVAEHLKEARSFGDLSENSEYDEAKDEQAKVYAKIDELKALIENAEIIELGEQPADTVTLSGFVTVWDVIEEEELTYKIVGSQEANPMQGRISDESPLGRALLGCRVGDTVTVEAPGGIMKYEIKSVKNI